MLPRDMMFELLKNLIANADMQARQLAELQRCIVDLCAQLEWLLNASNNLPGENRPPLTSPYYRKTTDA